MTPVLEIRTLTQNEAEKVHTRHLVMDFPPAEVTPFCLIRQLTRGGRYVTYGFFEDGELRAYAFIVRDKTTGYGLLDYFAVVSDFRGKGYGSAALELLKSKIDFPFMLEVENPESSCSEAEKQLRRRRISFYERADLVLTDVSATVFGTDYLVMYFGRELSVSEIKEIYRNLYLVKIGHIMTAIKVKIGGSYA